MENPLNILHNQINVQTLWLVEYRQANRNKYVVSLFTLCHNHKNNIRHDYKFCDSKSTYGKILTYKPRRAFQYRLNHYNIITLLRESLTWWSFVELSAFCRSFLYEGTRWHSIVNRSRISSENVTFYVALKWVSVSIPVGFNLLYWKFSQFLWNWNQVSSSLNETTNIKNVCNKIQSLTTP